MDILRLNILLLNEDPSLLDEMTEQLQAKGYKTSKASYLAEALNLIEHEQFDVIITDATMPDNDGVNLFKKIGSHIPVVMLSVNSDTLATNEIDQANCCFLEKSDIQSRLPKAVWTAFKRFKIDKQLLRDSDLAA